MGGKKFFNNKKRNFDKQSRDQDDESNDAKKDNRPSWLKLEREERHTGSYNFDELIKSPEYLAYADKRINPENSTKRKYALCISYLGTNYQGLQINPDAKTVEREIERALFMTGAIIDLNFGFLQKIQWTRAARTDRGVHALTQCIAARLLQPKEADLPGSTYDFLKEVNSFLPSDIRIQYMMRTTKAFNAKAQCTKRSYHYLLPTWAFQSSDIINKFLIEQYEEQGPIVGAGYEGGYVDPKSSKSLNYNSLKNVKNKLNLNKFRLNNYNSNILLKFNNILKKYEGTKHYHNFTSGKDSSEDNSKRYILSFHCSEPFLCPNTGTEWVLLEVLGQSFLLNQIRKMVGFALELTREENLSGDLFDLVFDPKSRCDVPMAPALGLFLNELYFEGYNNKMIKENEKNKNIKEKKAAAAASSTAAPVTEGEAATTDTPVAPVAAPATEAEDKEDDDICKEINFYGVPEVKEAINKFRDEVLTPHVLQQEEETLSFLYYFDYLRVHPQIYKAKNKKDEPKEE